MTCQTICRSLFRATMTWRMHQLDDHHSLGKKKSSSSNRFDKNKAETQVSDITDANTNSSSSNVTTNADLNENGQ
jgi:hypothetical protein